MLAQVLELGSRILFGTALILGGVVIARIVSNLVGGAGSEGWLPAILKWSIIALAVAIGLRFMGLANEIVIIAFASIIGSAGGGLCARVRARRPADAHKLLDAWTAGNRIPPPPRAPTAPDAAELADGNERSVQHAVTEPFRAWDDRGRLRARSEGHGARYLVPSSGVKVNGKAFLFRS
jgi:hypothetical protein